MAVDKLVDSTQLDSDLTSVADAIRAKSGGSASLAFPAGFVSEIQAIPSGGSGTPNIADFLSLTPVFDATWTTAEFSLVSYPSGGVCSLSNPLGEIPDYIVVIKKKITLSDIGGCIGGCNFIGGAKTDEARNRNYFYATLGAMGTNYASIPDYGMFGSFSGNNWSFIGGSSNAATASTIQFRCGTSKTTTAGYCLGDYILAVKKVQT